MVELCFDRRQIGEYVGMVKLQVVEDRCPRAVVNELRPLVAERSVVFVRFNDKERRVQAVARQPSGDSEV
jgi:hypothetical protein